MDAPTSAPNSDGAERAAVPAVVVAFDWNGTLVDDVDRAWAATCAVLANRGLPEPSLASFRADWRLPLSDLFQHYGVTEGLAEAAQDWNRAMGALPTQPTRAAKETLERLADASVPVGIVSAAAAAVVERDLVDLQLREGVIRFLYADADPKRAALSSVRAAYDSPVAFLGDTEYDMTEARAAGAVAIGFAGGYRPPEALVAAGAEYVVAQLDEVLDLVLGGALDRRAETTMREEGALEATRNLLNKTMPRLEAPEGGKA